MNLLQDRNFKLKYQKCKYKVKVWESEFKKKNGHNPTKDDIREAPSYVREAYKKYYDMKTKMLEELDILISEEALSPRNEHADSKADTTSGAHIKTGEANDKTEMHRVALADIQNCPETTDVNLPQKKPVAKEETIEQKPVKENDVWGVHLNVTKTSCEKKSLQRSFSSTFAEKLAKGAQFCKRNPRKSLSSRSSKNCKPGLFNTLSQDCESGSLSVSNISFSQESISDSVSLSCSLPFESCNLEKDTASPISFSSQLQTLKCISEKKTRNNHPISIVQKAVTSNSIDVKRNVDKGDKLMPESEDEEDSQYPSLEEAAAMAAKCNVPAQRMSMQVLQDSQLSSHQENENGHLGVKVPNYVLESLRQEEEKKVVDPIYPLGSDGSPMAPTEDVYSVLQEFGHTEFRRGQAEAIMRILSGLSTLVTLSTGTGKSLCYQLPALMYARHNKCITLVVSPLVSLMEDQVAGLPKCIKIACLHYNQTQSQRKEIMEQAKAGELHALLVSPEAIMRGGKNGNFGSIIQDLPPIAFACIDEAHCLSQWSHNFRPSYLMISEVLRSKLGVKTFLGLTATATFSTCRSILEHLQIPDDGKGVIKNVPLPDNLVLTASCDRRRDDALLTLLSGARFASCDSIIVYCIRRTECERLAVLLRTCLKEGQRPEEKKIRCQVSTNAEPYHAGLTAARRRLVQKRFMSGKTRIVVATVAFGMGIDKKDIRAVIHYNMPRNFESYVQEVGRAGRDGLPAHCHLFLDPDGADLQELGRHIFANSVDRHVIRKLLQRVFVPCRCNRLKKLAESSYSEANINGEEKISSNTSVKCPGHEVAFKVNETVQALDIPEENIATMLCYLELHPKKWIKVLSPVYTMCKVQSYGGPKAFKEAAKNSPPLAMAVALDQRQGIAHENSNKIEFPVVDVAAALNWDSGILKMGGKWKRTRICVEFQELGFRVLAPGMLPADELDEALDVLYERVESQERACLLQLQYAFDAFKSVAYKSCIECMDSSEESRSDGLKKQIREYFELQSLNFDMKIKEALMHEDQVIADTRQLVCSYPDTTFTGRAVARIFHGIESPCFPARSWGRCKYWRAHLNEDFKLLVKVATREILSLR
ncbi:Bloom syndrome protein homolog [Gryllus bimaculatus]|nr:Bloom syndrome protein homolog [Gryllus bimaculatus]